MMKRYLFALVAITVLCGATAASAGSGRKLYDRGLEAFEKGDYETAAKLFGEAWAAEPDPAYLFSEASMYRRLGKAEMAVTRYERYLEVVPPGERADKRAKAAGYAAEMHHAIGLELQVRGDCPAARLHFEKAVRHEPAHGAAWVSLAECSEAMGELDAAEATYAKALTALAPGDALSKKARARLDMLRTAKPMTDPAPAGVTLPAASDPAPPGEKEEKEKKRRSPALGIVIGVVGGALLAGTVVTVAVVAGRSRATPLEFPGGISVWDRKIGR